MPPFFFDFRDNGKITEDKFGAEFATAEEAHLDAFYAAQEMWSDLLKQRIDPRNCAIEVRDSERKLLFEVPFAEVLDVRDPPDAPAQKNNSSKTR